MSTTLVFPQKQNIDTLMGWIFPKLKAWAEIHLSSMKNYSHWPKFWQQKSKLDSLTQLMLLVYLFMFCCSPSLCSSLIISDNLSQGWNCKSNCLEGEMKRTWPCFPFSLSCFIFQISQRPVFNSHDQVSL